MAQNDSVVGGAQNDSVVGGPSTVVDLAAKDRPRTALKPEMYSKWSGADKGCYVPSAAPKKVTISVAEGATPVSGTWKSCQSGTTSSFSNVCSSNRGIGESVDREAGKAEREKYLTAKYPRKQMSFIRRRLDVEDWIDETLNSIYDVEAGDYSSTCGASIDLEELMDLDNDTDRITYLKEQLRTAPKPPSITNIFIRELLEKVDQLQTQF